MITQTTDMTLFMRYVWCLLQPWSLDVILELSEAGAETGLFHLFHLFIDMRVLPMIFNSSGYQTNSLTLVWLDE